MPQGLQAITAVRRTNDARFGLHHGEAFGLPGRVLACIAGLVPLGLAITGWLRWGDRRRACLDRRIGVATVTIAGPRPAASRPRDFLPMCGTKQTRPSRPEKLTA
jgi:uncharacterized iron-regulated membrane protein